jgi:leucyl-tRNA synthetase
VPADIAEEALKALALASENVQIHLEGQPPRKVIVVKGGQLVNIVK